MSATAYALSPQLFGNPAPKVRNRLASRSVFGDMVLLGFLLAQCLDGVFTYVGVTIYGLGIEANPVVAGLIAHYGQGVGLVGAKTVAATFGIALHLGRVHGAVAFLTSFYVIVAILPWIKILFF